MTTTDNTNGIGPTDNGTAAGNGRDGAPLHRRPSVVGLGWRLGPRDERALDQLLEVARQVAARGVRIELFEQWIREDDSVEWFAHAFARLAAVTPIVLAVSDQAGDPSLVEPVRGTLTPDEYGALVDEIVRRFSGTVDAFELMLTFEEERTAESTGHAATAARRIAAAAPFVHAAGHPVVVTPIDPIDPARSIALLGPDALDLVDAVGLCGRPRATTTRWTGWGDAVLRTRTALDAAGFAGDIWIAETGYSTWAYDEHEQVRAFADAISAPVNRVYWLGSDRADGGPAIVDDERETRYGMVRNDGSRTLLTRFWAERGTDGVRDLARVAAPAYHKYVGDRPVLITGGSGFVGTNLADRLVRSGRRVLLYDNLSRPGVEKNLVWLKRRHGERVDIQIADTRNAHALARAVDVAEQIFHFAAQVAVTTSLVDPIDDFATNARGTVNLLEAARRRSDKPGIVFTSTNKVYGGLDDLRLRLNGTRYEPEDPSIRARGIDERRPLDFHSPYGCSKGCADQYLIDYARTYGVPTVVFRMSCIYGPHQFGTEDQGWVAHFVLRAMDGLPITLYGDGHQVRDVLFVEDLVDAFLLAQQEMPTISGRAFNIGGGPERAVSLRELVGMLGAIEGRDVPIESGEWRPGDQRYYVSDTTSFRQATGWSPMVDIATGVARLHEWLVSSRADRAALHSLEVPA